MRSESGRSDPTTDPTAPRGQRPARLAQGRPRRGQGRARRAGGWAKRTAYNRGQVLYRFAEALESRSTSSPAPRWRSRTCAGDARAEVGAAVDLLVHYAGWTDKLAAVMGGINPVAAPYLSLLRPRADRRRRRAGARRARRARAGPRGRARRWPRATRSSPSSRAAGRCARWTSARSPASPTSRAAC